MENLKQIKQEIKKQIKVLSQEQRLLKNQRKTVNIVGERTMEPWQAAYKHSSNRYELYTLYGVYAFLRGRNIEQILTDCGIIISQQTIDRYIEKYEKVVCIDK